MAVTVGTLRSWLETLDDNSDVWVDESGIVLVNKGNNYEAYIEVGGERDTMRSCLQKCGGRS